MLPTKRSRGSGGNRVESGFDLYISELVVQEVRAGDAALATRRLEILRDIPVLAVDSEILKLAQALVTAGPIPRKAAGDAAHIAYLGRRGRLYTIGAAARCLRIQALFGRQTRLVVMPINDEEGLIESGTEGGLAGTHPAAPPFRLLVAPSTSMTEFNRVQLHIAPIACWRVDDIRFNSIPLLSGQGSQGKYKTCTCCERSIRKGTLRSKRISSLRSHFSDMPTRSEATTTTSR